MVGRLIEHQQVLIAGHKPGQRRPAALAPAQGREGFGLIVFIKEHRAGQVARFLFGVVGHKLAQIFNDGQAQVHVVVGLSEVAHLHLRPEADLPGVGRLLAEQTPNERAFAGPVRADHADAIATFDHQIHVLEEGDRVVAHAQILRFDDHVARANRGREANVHLRLSFGRG